MPSVFPSIRVFSSESVLASRGQSFGVSASASVLPMNIQDWSPLGLTGWISLQPKFSQESSPPPQFKSITSSVLSFLYGPIRTCIYDYWKNHNFDLTDLCGNVISLPFNMLSRCVVTFLPRSKHCLISWLQSPSAVNLEPPKIKSVTVSIAFPIYLPIDTISKIDR